MCINHQSEIIYSESDADEFKYSIDEDDQIACVIGLKAESNSNRNAFIPRSINFRSKEYLITSISKGAFKNFNNIKSIQFAENSELRTINKCAFAETSIESIIIPSSVEKLKNGCFIGAHKLNKINVMPNNQYYSVYDDKFIIGKFWPEQDDFIILVLCVCDIEVAKIPNFIEIIGPYAFCECKKLQRIEFTEDSKLQTIDKYAFYNSSIESIVIPKYCNNDL